MKKNENCRLELKSKIRRIPEFKGVVFWDITPLLKDKKCFGESIRLLADHYRGKEIDVIVSNEARGFIVGAALAYELGVGFVPIRNFNAIEKFVNQDMISDLQCLFHGS